MTDVPRIPVPSTGGIPKIRKGQPAPFSRPRIDLDGTSVRREWRRIPSRDIRIGDNVPGVGVVEDVDEVIILPNSKSVDLDFTLRGARRTPADWAGPGEWTVTVTGGDKNSAVYDAREEILVFTVVEDQA